MHGPRHSIAGCKVFQEYSEKHAGQRPHIEFHASGKETRGNILKLKSSAVEINHIIERAVYTDILENGKIKWNCDPEIEASDVKVSV